MNAMSGKEFARLLEANGWKLLRVASSHHIYGKPGEVAKLSVPIHGNEMLKPGLQRHPMRMANL